MSNGLSAATANSERVFVGAILNGDARALDSGLKATDFTDGFCGRVFSAALTLEERGQICDLVTLSDIAPDVDASTAVELTVEALGHGALAGQYALTIRTAARRRAVTAECLSLASDAQDADKPLSELLDATRARLDALAGNLPSSGLQSGTDALCGFYERLVGSEVQPVVTSGFPRLDRALCIAGGKLIVIGARPSVGKSALLLHLAMNALDAGRRVLLVSLEMGADELIGRMVARQSGVPVQAISTHRLTETELGRVVEGFSFLPGESFTVCTTARTASDVRREALRMRANGGLDLIVVDYLQLLEAGRKASSRVEAVGIISRTLKLLAVELKVPVLTASQLNRASERNDAPRLSDLRESGSIEQDADAVLLLHAANEKENPERDLTLAKNRQGRCGGFKLLFSGERMLFTEATGERNKQT